MPITLFLLNKSGLIEKSKRLLDYSILKLQEQLL
jgi:hypothetical protein